MVTAGFLLASHSGPNASNSSPWERNATTTIEGPSASSTPSTWVAPARKVPVAGLAAPAEMLHA